MSTFISKLKSKIFLKSIKLDKKYQSSLSQGSSQIKLFYKQLFSSRSTVDEQFFKELEHFLLDFNVHYDFVKFLIRELKKEAKIHNIKEDELNYLLVDKILSGYEYFINQEKYQFKLHDDKVSVILVAGTNGSGKTTFIGKLAKFIKTKHNKKVLLVAADTYRPAAANQLNYWAKEAEVDILLPEKKIQDPSSLLYKAIKKTKIKKNYDVIICDTSGRLENKVGLMNQLKKMYKVVNKLLGYDPSDFLITLDITIGYHLIEQIKGFQSIGEITGFVLNKVDGSTKPGIVLSFPEQFKIPIKFLGIGEKIDDLEVFIPKTFLFNLFQLEK